MNLQKFLKSSTQKPKIRKKVPKKYTWSFFRPVQAVFSQNINKNEAFYAKIYEIYQFLCKLGLGSKKNEFLKSFQFIRIFLTVFEWVYGKIFACSVQCNW